MGSSPADGLGSFPSVMSGMSEGPLPAGVQPLCDSNGSSSSSSPPPMQTGLKVVDGPSPADGLGSHGSLYGGDVARVSSHGAPSSVCTGTGCTGSSSDGSAGLSGAQLRQKEDLAKRIIGQEFPWMGDCASAWDNAVDTVMRDLGEGFELRRHNKANAFLAHLTPGSGRQEHPCPRKFDNEVTMAEIDHQEEMIRDIHEARVGTKESYKVPEGGQGFGRRQVEEKTTDAHAFVTDFHRNGCFVRFATDSQKRITCVFFATPEQVELLTHYGSVIIQDNTFNTNAYKYQLCLVVVDDKENRTQIACQALVLRQRTEDFVFIFECVAEMGTKHPKNIQTHLGGLGSVSSKVVATFQAAAYALTESDFFKRDFLELLPSGGKANAYMNGHIFGRYEKCASHVHPGARTLGMSSTQRVESANSAIKQGLTRASSMMGCLRAITKLNQAWTNTSQKKTWGGSYNRVALGTSNADGAVRDILLVQVEPFFKGQKEVGASTYAKEFEAEPSTWRLQRSVTINQTTATASVTACDTEGNSTGTSAAVDSTMLPRPSLAHFVDLIRDQSIHQLLRVTPKRGKNKYGGHLVALGPDGFCLCPCLQLLIKGLPCRDSILALLETQVAFNGACGAARWRTNATDWTMEPVASKPARLAGTSAEASAAQQQIALGSSVFTPSIENVRSANYANCCAFGKEAGTLLDGITTIEGANRILRHCKKALMDSIAVEEETQREVGRTTLFKGIAAQEDGGVGGGRAGGGGREYREAAKER
eukprot:jgi/Undpi1/11635/HiC_scaffold_35.g13930.m1